MTPVSSKARSSPRRRRRLVLIVVGAILMAVVFNGCMLLYVTTTTVKTNQQGGYDNDNDRIMVGFEQSYQSYFNGSNSSNNNRGNNDSCPCLRRHAHRSYNVDGSTSNTDSNNTISCIQQQQQHQQVQQQHQPDSATTAISSSLLLPLPVRYLRRGMSLEDAYPSMRMTNKAHAIATNPKCSCQSDNSNPKCCQRVFRRVHKMGYVLTLDAFSQFDPYIQLYGIEPKAYNYLERKPVAVDYRDVLLWRNIYDSIVSGYLYHKDGRECYKDPWGNLSNKHHYHLVRNWKKHLNTSYGMIVPPSKRHIQMLCRYLEKDNEERGLRVYIEWVFKVHYHVMLSMWGLSQGIPFMKERTMNVCYEDLVAYKTDPNHTHATMTNVLDFFFNGTNHKPWKGFPQQTDSEAGTRSNSTNAGVSTTTTNNASSATTQVNKDAAGHATSSDPRLRHRLIKIIKRLDFQYYNGDIAWLDSMLPC